VKSFRRSEREDSFAGSHECHILDVDENGPSDLANSEIFTKYSAYHFQQNNKYILLTRDLYLRITQS
jgi:hypothetical protein